MRSLLEGPPGTLLVHLLARELKTAAASQALVSLAFIDMDDFTGFNDRHGWAKGTMLLERIAERLEAIVLHVEAGSFGGDEFAVLLPNTNDTEAIQNAKTALRGINLIARDQGICRERIRASIGGTTSIGGSTPADMIRLAHDALVVAKRHGGNCIAWADFGCV